MQSSRVESFFFIINEKYLKTVSFYKDSSYAICNSREEAIFETKQALKKGFQKIVAVGGDGTLNAVANGFFENQTLLNPEAKIFVTNLGTGHDYYRTVFENKKSTLLEYFQKFEVKKIDVGIVKTNEETLYFLNSCSLGITPLVLKLKEKLQLPRKLKYFFATLMALFLYRTKKFEVSLDGERLQEDFIALLFCKGKFAGCGMKLSHHVNLVDGAIESLFVKSVANIFVLLPRLYKLYKNNLGKDKFVRQKMIKHANINHSSDFSLELDGEIMSVKNPTISLLTQSLPIAFPVL
jgi:diacylglycerol kinase family enzyme